MKYFKRLNVLILGFFFCLNSYIFYGKITYLYTDFGREAFYPLAVLQGEVLYRDIFNIYGPFSYLFNAFLYHIAGANINTLYLAGMVNAFLILLFTYLISRKFLNRVLSFGIVFCVMQSVVFTKYLMNFIQPYSFAVVYGLSAMLISMFCYLRFFDTKNDRFAYAALFFSGIAFICKYEFFFYPLILFAALFFLEKRKKPLKDFFIFILPFLVSFSYLFIKGLTLSDIIHNAKLVIKCSQTDALHYFLSHSAGFSTEGLLLSMISILLLATVTALFGFVNSKFRNILLLWLLIPSMGVLLFITKTQNVLLQGLPILLIILFTVKFKKIIKDRTVLFLLLCTLGFSIKSLAGLNIPNGYGTYSLGLLLISLCCLIPFYEESDRQKSIYVKTIAMLLCTVGFSNMLMNFYLIKDRDYKINTPAGTIKNTPKASAAMNKLIAYIEKNTQPSDKIVVLPEPPLINFLTGRKSDNYYNDFTPDRLEAYTEERVITHYSDYPPDYFILIKYPQKPYGKGAFSEDYGNAIFEWIEKNYSLENTISDDIPILIFKKI